MSRHATGASNAIEDGTRVVAVVVSFNRRALLEQSLNAIFAAHQRPDALVVVDNASTDGSPDFLRQFHAPVPYELVELATNTGGAGGFAVGMAHALANHKPDLVWIMDDDTEAHTDTLAEAVRLWQNTPVTSRPAFIASTVEWTDGRNHPMNNPRTRYGASERGLAKWAALHARPVRSASFVSLFVSAEAARNAGLPIVDYFLWNDDFEYTARLAKDRYALASEASRVSHHTAVFNSNTQDVGERFFYEVRNKLWMFFRSSSLTAKERVLYGGSTLLRWVSMVRRSSSRKQVLQAGLRGVRAALSSPPRANEVALDGIHTVPQWQLPAGEHQSTPGFSVLLPVYGEDSPKDLERAFRSVTTEQTLRPAQVVVVQDGPVPVQLGETLRELVAESTVPVELVQLPEQSGLAVALDSGLERCNYPFVARMDADDISLPERFATELPYLWSGFDIVGSAIEEFDVESTEPGAYRPVVLEPDRLAANTAFRSPFHHPSVVFRADAVRAVGGYAELNRMEDFWLWLRLLKTGYRGVNVPQALVKYRVSSGAYDRRGGLALLKAELSLQGKALQRGYITPAQWLRNVVVRASYRLIPTDLRRRGYRLAFTRESSSDK